MNDAFQFCRNNITAQIILHPENQAAIELSGCPIPCTGIRVLPSKMMKYTQFSNLTHRLTRAACRSLLTDVNADSVMQKIDHYSPPGAYQHYAMTKETRAYAFLHFNSLN